MSGLARALVVVVCITATAAQAIEIVGPATRVQLIELFTSEGCSSCPPADAFLRRLGRETGLWTRFVPVARHVDYWDRLGWRDRFASSTHSARQRDYVRRGLAGGVYTPGWYVDGREWRGFFEGESPLAEDSARDRPGALRLQWDAGIARLATAAPALRAPTLRMHAAVLGSGLATAVRRGENSGRQLQHDFVLLSSATGAFRDGSGAVRIAASTIAAPRQAITAWITRGDDPRPLQAVGGWLPTATR